MTIQIPDNYYSLKAKIEYLRERKPIIDFPKIPKLPPNLNQNFYLTSLLVNLTKS